MENLYKYISTISPGIDRVDFSVPMLAADNVIKQLSALSQSDNSLVHTSKQKPERPDKPQYWYQDYLVNGDWVTVSAKSKRKNAFDYNDRAYINLYDPKLETQQIIAQVLRDVTGGISKGIFGAIIRQLEISYDIYCNDDADCMLVHDFLHHHLVLKYAKKSSYKAYKSTDYVGKYGNIRKGVWGIRSYIKTEFGRTFCRLEFQYNRQYLLKNDITVLGMPFSPLQFESLRNIALLDNFTLKGICNLSRTVLRKSGVTESNSKDFNKLYRKMMQKISSCVLGGREQIKPVPMQIAAVKDIAKKAGVSCNNKRYFPSLVPFLQLICCHADIGYQEEECSKRMLFCQTG